MVPPIVLLTFRLTVCRVARVGEVLGGGSDVVQHFAWDGNNIVLTFSGAPGAAGGGSLTDRYLTGSALDQVFADETALGNILWPLTDAEGTVRDVVNARGIVQDHLTYGAFGNLTGQTNPAAQPAFLYDGLLYDPIINKSYDQARWYDAETGRFLSPDPTGFAAGDVNLDRFTGNSPTNATDPTGLDRQLGPWSSWLNGIASDRGRWPATQILAGTLVGPTALVDTLPGAIQDAASAVREEMARVAAATNDPVQRFMATYVGPPLTQFGEVFAQLGNATGATAPLLATGATVPAAGAFLAHPITTNSLRALAVTGGTLNAFDAIQEGTFSGSDAFFVGAPFLGAQADLGRLRGYLDLNPPSNPLNYRFFVNRTTFTSNGIGAGDLRFVAPVARVPANPTNPYNISTTSMSAAERAATIEYAQRTNAWLAQNGPVRVQPTAGTLRSQASAAARAERLRAARAGQPYQGQAGHVPDKALTGQAAPPGGWLDMPGTSNNVAGGGLSSRIGQTVDVITVDGQVPPPLP